MGMRRRAAKTLLGHLEELPEDPALWEAADEEGRRRIEKHPFGAQIAVLVGPSCPR